MLGVVGVAAALTVFALSVVITRLATVALTMTGLSRQAARFQARSAFTGTGFTTSEAEKVVNHPVRRRIIMGLMMLRSAGVVTIVLSMILSFANTQPEDRPLLRLGLLIAGAAILLVLANSRWLDHHTSSIMQRALNRWTDLDTRDYASLLRLSSNYTVMEVHVREGDWLAGKSLSECQLPSEGVTVLGVYRDNGDYIGAPRSTTKIYPNDTLLLYGRADTVRQLDLRRDDPEGERAHEEAVEDQERHLTEQDQRERAHDVRREESAGTAQEGE